MTWPIDPESVAVAIAAIGAILVVTGAGVAIAQRMVIRLRQSIAADTHLTPRERAVNAGTTGRVRSGVKSSGGGVGGKNPGGVGYK